MEPAQSEIENLLRKQHKLSANKPLDFHVRNQAMFLETLEESGQTFTYMILGIAIVSLVVGGIGIMNIMLVSVTERTREIGLRKAVGAKRRDILGQFLIESTALSVIGGLVGIGIGVFCAKMVPSLWEWRTIISPIYTGLAFFVAGWIGIFFGAYPHGKQRNCRQLTHCATSNTAKVTSPRRKSSRHTPCAVTVAAHAVKVAGIRRMP